MPIGPDGKYVAPSLTGRKKKPDSLLQQVGNVVGGAAEGFFRPFYNPTELPGAALRVLGKPLSVVSELASIGMDTTLNDTGLGDLSNRLGRALGNQTPFDAVRRSEIARGAKPSFTPGGTFGSVNDLPGPLAGVARVALPFAASVGLDPATYISGGLSTITKGEEVAATLSKAVEAGLVAPDVAASLTRQALTEGGVALGKNVKRMNRVDRATEITRAATSSTRGAVSNFAAREILGEADAALSKVFLGQRVLKFGDTAIPGTERIAEALAAGGDVLTSVVRRNLTHYANSAKGLPGGIKVMALGRERQLQIGTAIAQVERTLGDAPNFLKITDDIIAKSIASPAARTATSHFVEEVVNDGFGQGSQNAKRVRDWGKEAADGGAGQLTREITDIQNAWQKTLRGEAAPRNYDTFYDGMVRDSKLPFKEADATALGQLRLQVEAKVLTATEAVAQGRTILSRQPVALRATIKAVFKDAANPLDEVLRQALDPNSIDQVAIHGISQTQDSFIRLTSRAYDEALKATGSHNRAIEALHGERVFNLSTIEDFGQRGVAQSALSGKSSRQGGLFGGLLGKTASFGQGKLEALGAGTSGGRLVNAAAGREGIYSGAVVGAFNDFYKGISAQAVMSRTPSKFLAVGSTVKLEQVAEEYSKATRYLAKQMKRLGEKEEILKGLKNERDVIASTARALGATEVQAQQLSDLIGSGVAHPKVLKADIRALLDNSIESGSGAAASLLDRATSVARQHAKALGAVTQLEVAETATRSNLDDLVKARNAALNEIGPIARKKESEVIGILKADRPHSTLSADEILQSQDDMRWINQALALAQRHYVRLGESGWVDKVEANYIGSLLSDSDALSKMASYTQGLTRYVRSALLTTPGFASRNLISAAINNSFYSAGWREAAAFNKVWRQGGVDESWFQYLVEVMPSALKGGGRQAARGVEDGVLDNTVLRGLSKLSGAYEDFSVPKRIFSGSLGTPGSGVLGRISGAGTIDVETLMRGSLFKKLVDDGWSFEAAWQRVGITHVNYSDVTKTDVALKNIIPFWSYMSRSVPRELEMARHGGYLGQQIETERRRTIGDGGDLPPFAQQTSANLGDGYSLGIAGLNPTTEVLNLFDQPAGAPQAALSMVTSGLHPLLRTTLDLGAGQKYGKSFRFGDAAVQLLPTLRSLEALVPTAIPDINGGFRALDQVPQEGRLPVRQNLAAALFGVNIRGYGR